MPMPMPYTPGQAPLTAPTLTSTFHNHSPEPFSEQGCKATTTSPMSLQNAEAPASSRHHVGPSPAPYVPRSRNTHANQIGGGGAGAALPTPAAISVSSLYGTSFVSPASRSCFARCAVGATHHFHHETNFGTDMGEDVFAAGLSCSRARARVCPLRDLSGGCSEGRVSDGVAGQMLAQREGFLIGDEVRAEWARG